MKKQLLIFIAPEVVQDQVRNVKNEIISYLGLRMIDDRMEGLPALAIAEELDDDARRYVVDLINHASNDMVGLLITKEEDQNILQENLVDLIPAKR